MKRLVIKPDGWPCLFNECPPGLFIQGKILGIKGTDGWMGVCGNHDITGLSADNGQGLICGTYPEQIEVQPVVAEWEEYE